MRYSLALFVSVFLTCLFTGRLMAERTLDQVIVELRESYPQVANVSARELEGWLNQGRDLLLLDARTEAEFNVSHLKSAIRIDPESNDFRWLDDLGARNKTVVLYCSVGWRSSRLADSLMRSGYRQVYNLEGSLFRWAELGLPVFRGDTSVQEVHPYDSRWGKLLPQKYHPAEQ